MVIHWVGSLANLVESLASTNPTVWGAVPCAMTESGVSLPVTNHRQGCSRGATLKNGAARRTFVGLYCH